VVAVPADSAGEPNEFAARRRLLTAALAAVLILAAAGSYLIWRSINRERAIARLQSDFVAAVSHEFRTPLTALRQFNEMLGDEEDLPLETRRTYNEAQTRATDRLYRLVESLLDFGPLESGHWPYHFEPLDAAALARDVAEDFRNEVRGRGYTVQVSVDSGDYQVNADSEALARALWNLLENSVKYSGERCVVYLDVGRLNGAVTLAVRDRGIGIPASERKRIFQKFVRGTEAVQHGIKGTGLGLTMVRHIAEAHGGSVRVKSAPGEGSTFTIILPAKE